MCLFCTSHTHTFSITTCRSFGCMFPPVGGFNACTVARLEAVANRSHRARYLCKRTLPRAPMHAHVQPHARYPQHTTCNITHTHIYIYVYTHTALTHLFIFSLSPFFPSMSSSWISWRKKTCWRGVWEDEDSWGQWTSPMESWWLFSEHVLFRGLDWSGIWIGDMPLNLIGMTNKSSE